MNAYTKITDKWMETKEEIKNVWKDIGDQDLEKTKGDVKAIGDLIEQKYHLGQEAVHAKLTGLLDGLKAKTNAKQSEHRNENDATSRTPNKGI